MPGGPTNPANEYYGALMPEGLKENDYFPPPIITPSTKAEAGHDEDISKEEIISKGIGERKRLYTRWKSIPLPVFEFGKQLAAKRGPYPRGYQI